MTQIIAFYMNPKLTNVKLGQTICISDIRIRYFIYAKQEKTVHAQREMGAD